jgi:hypothetical protein
MSLLHIRILFEEISGQVAPSWSHKVLAFSAALVVMFSLSLLVEILT